MSHYKSNLKDMKFNLLEVFGGNERLGVEPFTEFDPDTATNILDEVDILAKGKLSDTLTTSDRNPPIYDPINYTVTMPEDFKNAYQELMDAEWWRLELPEELGGMNAPPSLRWAVSELLLGSNPAAFMYMAGPGFAGILHAIGNDEQKVVAQHMVDRQWGATMVLTEPDAGSDVGAGRAKATLNADGTWTISGVKRFITSAEHDMAENIIHLVLARPEGIEGAGGPGTKGLSLFLVPKYHFDPATGELGERNGVYVTNVEKKMGLKVSTTCELTFTQNPDDPAVGWLVGDVHQGIQQMFKVIEYARMMVGTKAIATLSTGYLNALEYAKTRTQGADMVNLLDKTAPKVTIIHHPDVRRELMLQKVYAEGLRALVAYTASVQDKIIIAHTHGESEGHDVKFWDNLNDFLLPLVKGVGSERSYEMLAHSLQTLGGSGYLQDYPIEQYIRDAKIDTLYEGTTAIQGLDFFFRKIVKNNFESLNYILTQIENSTTEETALPYLTVAGEELRKVVGEVRSMTEAMTMWAFQSQQTPEEIYKTGLNTTKFLMVVGDVLIGWFLYLQGMKAHHNLHHSAAALKQDDVDFYEGKIVSAHWFATNRLPLVAGELKALQSTDLNIMTMKEGSF